MLSAATLVQLAMNAGFSAGDAATAAAIALAESAGNPSAVGDNGQSFGLWQIYTPDHPEFRGWNLLDPQTNANAAFSVWSAAGGSFTPWTTYRTGKYLAFLTGGLSPAGPTAAPLVTAPAESSFVTPDGGGPTWTTVFFLTAAAAGLYFLADSLAD